MRKLIQDTHESLSARLTTIATDVINQKVTDKSMIYQDAFESRLDFIGPLFGLGRVQGRIDNLVEETRKGDGKINSMDFHHAITNAMFEILMLTDYSNRNPQLFAGRPEESGTVPPTSTPTSTDDKFIPHLPDTNAGETDIHDAR